MSEAAAVEVSVGVGVVLAIVNLRELKTSVLMKILSVEVLMGAEDLYKENTAEFIWLQLGVHFPN